MSQIAFPLTHAGTATNPFAFTNETTFRTKKTASPVYTAVAITQDITPSFDGKNLDVRQAGSHLLYGAQNAGVDYGFTVAVHPKDTPFLKYGTEPPNYVTPAGTSAESLQFVTIYKQATGTAGMLDHYMFFLGCKPDTTTISVSAQSLVEASMTWGVGEIPPPSSSSGLTTPTFPTFASITGPVFQDSDGGTKPLTINSVPYAVNPFSITWNNNLIRDAFNGSGLVDALTVGAISITGSLSTPVGQDLLLETRMADVAQTGVVAKYVVKTGVCVINMTGFVLTSNARPMEGAPTNTLKNTFSFKCATATVGTS